MDWYEHTHRAGDVIFFLRGSRFPCAPSSATTSGWIDRPGHQPNATPCSVKSERHVSWLGHLARGSAARSPRVLIRTPPRAVGLRFLLVLDKPLSALRLRERVQAASSTSTVARYAPARVVFAACLARRLGTAVKAPSWVFVVFRVAVRRAEMSVNCLVETRKWLDKVGAAGSYKKGKRRCHLSQSSPRLSHSNLYLCQHSGTVRVTAAYYRT